MSESIFSRVSRLFSATVEETVDKMEAAGGDWVMREAIREAARAIDQVQSQMETAAMRRSLGARQIEQNEVRVAELAEKARFALAEGREDLAEAALSRQIDIEAEIRKLNAAGDADRAEEARLAEGLAALKSRKLQMEESLTAYLAARREAEAAGETLAGGAPRSSGADSAGKQVDRAEEAFDRAMASQNGAGFSPGDAQAINGVAEIDKLQRGAELAARMKALKKTVKTAKSA